MLFHVCLKGELESLHFVVKVLILRISPHDLWSHKNVREAVLTDQCCFPIKYGFSFLKGISHWAHFPK